MARDTAAAKSVRVTADALIVELRDGRAVSVPLEWYPRLVEGTPRQRRRWELIGPGIGIHWPDLDEDVSVEALLRVCRRTRARRRSNDGVHLDARAKAGRLEADNIEKRAVHS